MREQPEQLADRLADVMGTEAAGAAIARGADMTRLEVIDRALVVLRRLLVETGATALPVSS